MSCFSMKSDYWTTLFKYIETWLFLQRFIINSCRGNPCVKLTFSIWSVTFQKRRITRANPTVSFSCLKMDQGSCIPQNAETCVKLSSLRGIIFPNSWHKFISWQICLKMTISIYGMSHVNLRIHSQHFCLGCHTCVFGFAVWCSAPSGSHFLVYV